MIAWCASDFPLGVKKGNASIPQIKGFDQELTVSEPAVLFGVIRLRIHTCWWGEKTRGSCPPPPIRGEPCFYEHPCRHGAAASDSLITAASSRETYLVYFKDELFNTV